MNNTYKLIMDSRYNPLSNIPDNNTRHMVMASAISLSLLSA